MCNTYGSEKQVCIENIEIVGDIDIDVTNVKIDGRKLANGRYLINHVDKVGTRRKD